MYLFPVTSGTKNSANFIYHLIELQLVAQNVKESFFFTPCVKKKKVFAYVSIEMKNEYVKR